MSSKKKLLKKTKKYFFCVFHGINPETIEKIQYKYLGIRTIKLFSEKFDQLTEEIYGLIDSFPEEFRDYKYFRCHEQSILFYSETENSLNNLYLFLIAIRPSKIQKWLEFETYYPDLQMREIFGNRHATNGISIWKRAITLHDELEAEDIFQLTDSDILYVNRMLRRYPRISKTPSYKHFIGLYYRAYIEETDYFKYLLLFIIIESLIPPDDKTGITYKIRRFCAVMVGDSLRDSQLIFKYTSDAYNVRSSIVHSGKNNLTEARYLQFLHSIVCEVGILLLIGELKKDTIFNTTTTLGFGQRNQLIKDNLFKKYSNISINSINFYLFE